MKQILLVTLLFSTAAGGFAGVTVTASVDTDTVGTEDVLTYTIRVVTDSGKTSAISVTPPAVKGAADMQGPSSSSSMETRLVNGSVSISSTRSYTWLIYPDRGHPRNKLVEGTIRIGEAMVRVDGQLYKTKPKTVKVTEGSLRRRRGGRRSPWDLFSGDPFGDDPFFRRRQRSQTVVMTAELDKKKAVVGEEVMLTFRIYTDVQLAGIQMKDSPALEGFRVEELKQPTRPKEKQVEVRGKTLATLAVKKLALYPLKSGRLTIPESRWQIQTGLGSFFDMPRQLTRETRPVILDVSPVPTEGRLPDWQGAVGQFKVKASLDREEVPVNEPVNLTVSLDGRGDLRSVRSLPMPELPDFKVYDPKIEEQVETRGGQLHSHKVFRYLLVARAPGEQAIPPIQWCFFDPKAKRYRQLATQGFHLTVTGGGKEAQTSIPLPVSGRRISVVGKDIRYLKRFDPTDLHPAPPVWRRTWFLLGLLLPLLANLAFAGVRWRRRHNRMFSRELRARRALAVAVRKLKRTRRVKKAGGSKEFHQAIADAIEGYLADRFDLARAGLTLGRIAEKLEESGCPQDAIGELRELLDECDQARFTPAASPIVAGQEPTGRALEIVKRIDRAVKPKRQARRAAALTLLVMLLGTVGSRAAVENPETIWKKATEAYDAGRFEESEQGWQSLLDAGYGSASLYFNLGDAALKAGHIGHSILAFRKALKLDPTDQDAVANLAFAVERATDEAARHPAASGVAGVLNRYFGAERGAVAALLAFLASQILLAWLLLRRRGGRLPLVILVVFMVIATAFASYAAGLSWYQAHHRLAVVLQPKIEARSGPGEGNANIFVVHEGLTVLIRDERNGYALVTLPNNLSGWLPIRSLGIV